VIGFFYIWHFVAQIRKESVKQSKLLKLLWSGSTGQGGMVGRVGVMLTHFNSSFLVGQAKVDGEEWDCTAGEPLKAGVQVRVTGVNGVILVVEKAEVSEGPKTP
jgi:membrane-bound ClpP family serine protease